MQPASNPTLTEPERHMWDAVMAGHGISFGDGDPRELTSRDAWGPERTIRGHVLAALLTSVGVIAPSAVRQVHIQGARVVGEVDLRHAELAVAVQLERCIFERRVILAEARTRALRFSICALPSVDATGAFVEGLLAIGHSTIQHGVSLLEAKVSNSVMLSGSKIVGDAKPALSADRLEAGGGLSMDGGFHATGEVRLLGAQITGQLICSGGRFDNPGGVALGADRANIKDDARLDAGFNATGEVRLLGTQISGQLICSGGRFENPGDRAIAADGAIVGASVVLGGLPNSTTDFLAIGTVQLTGARIAGQLNCSGGQFHNPGSHALIADGAEIGAGVFLSKSPGEATGSCASGEVRLPGARIVGQLNCSGGRFDNPESVALVADGADIRGDVYLGNGLHATGTVRLLGTHVSGQLNCSGGRFDNPGGIALGADGADIRDRLFLHNGFHATGEVRLLNAQIGSEFNCFGGRFDNPKGLALRADGADIQGGVNLHMGFHATGEVYLVGTRIGTGLNCSGGRFDNPGGDALVLDSARIGGTVFLSSLPGGDGGFHATGVVRLLGTRIIGQLNCSGGRFDNPEAIALAAERAEISDNVQLSDGFHATGALQLMGIRIGGQLNCSGGWFDNPGRTALNLQEAQANSLWLRGPNFRAAGAINFAQTKVSLLADDPATLTCQHVTLHLDGFKYTSLAPDSPQDVKTRLQWLGIQRPGYHPQPFDQLAAVFRRNGQDYEARDVLVAKRRKRRGTLQRLRSRRWDWFLEKSVLYGWQPWRPLVLGLGVFLHVLGLVIGAQAAGFVVGPPDTTASYHPLIHALDVFLPFVELGVESSWTIDTNSGGALAWLVISYLWFLKLLGWGTVTLALAAVTRIVQRE